MTDRYEKLDYADRWSLDALTLSKPPGYFIMMDIDMTATQEIIAQLRRQGIKGTYTHVMIRATALAFKRHPELNRLLVGKRLVYLDSIDIGLAVGSPLALSGNPSMVVQNADQKDLKQIAQEIIERAPGVREGYSVERARVRRVAHIIPGWARRFLFRIMMSKVSFIKKVSGTFFVTSVPHLRYAIPLVYPCSGMLVITGVEERVIAKDGQPVVRPMMTLGNVGDRRLWDGNSAGHLLDEIKKILEEGVLAEELSEVEALTPQL
jgi:pyruvate/2-oxoglutarate dehydrogenase complex dihydrolipoamide acyltransferase (E2) component